VKVISTLEQPRTLALAFKVMNLSFAKLVFIRVYLGKILANSYVYNVNKREKERISRLVKMHANKKKEVSEVGMRDIAAVIGLKHTITGDTLYDEEEDILLEQISFAKP
ncbi:18378_t:CDS:1, partial [Gigaspora rosea]